MPRTRDRHSAEGLLPRMEARPWADGKTVTYRYHPIGGKPMNLGTDKIAAMRKVLDMNGQRDTYGTLGWVWEQFQDAPRWKKLADVTRSDYTAAWKQIEPVLGHMPIADIDSPTVARYVHIERAGSPRRADIEKSLLSRLFGHGIKLGVCTINATIGVEPHGSERFKRYWTSISARNTLHGPSVSRTSFIERCSAFEAGTTQPRVEHGQGLLAHTQTI